MVTDSTCTQNNYVWDFSNLIPNSQWVRKFNPPSSFVFPFNVVFNPINTSYGEEQYMPDNIPLIGKPDNGYNFFKETSTRFKQVGGGFTINSLPLPFIYNPHDTVYRFPLSCGNRDTSYAAFGLSIPGIGYYGQQIRRWNFADGQGNLITPFGTFQTVRVRSLIAIRDTFSDTSGTFGFAANRPLQYEFKWLGKGGKIPYLQVNAINIGGNVMVTQIQYRDSMRGVPQVGIEDWELQTDNWRLMVYPNPASEMLFVSYTLQKPKNVKIELLDLTGRKIYERLSGGFEKNAGEHIEIINLREVKLNSGIYFVKVMAGTSKRMMKVVIM
jgi:hypothetical protein